MLVKTDDETVRTLIRDELKEFFNPTPKVDENGDVEDVTEQDYDTDIRTGYPFGDPVAVQILNDKPLIVVPRGSVQWVGEKTIVTPGSPQLLVGKNPYRRTVILWNIGINNIAFGNTTNVKFGGIGNYGAPELPTGFSITMDTTAEIWAIADPASTNGEPINVVQIVETGHDS